jgi:hypothetical protein
MHYLNAERNLHSLGKNLSNPRFLICRPSSRNRVVVSATKGELERVLEHSLLCKAGCELSAAWINLNSSLKTIMNSIDLLYSLAGIVALGLIFHGVTDWFSQSARLGRKRRRNHGRISNKSRRPTVMLSVRMKKA